MNLCGQLLYKEKYREAKVDEESEDGMTTLLMLALTIFWSIVFVYKFYKAYIEPWIYLNLSLRQDCLKLVEQSYIDQLRRCLNSIIERFLGGLTYMA